MSKRAACRVAFVVLLVPLPLAACRSPRPSAPIAIRLTDQFKPAALGGRSETSAPPRAEWRFDRPPTGAASEPFGVTRGWEAGPGIGTLGVRDGRLTGRTTSTPPILHVERRSTGADPDLLYAVEVRLRASAGRNLAVAFLSDEKLDLVQTQRDARLEPWETTTPLLPGDEFHTYSLHSPGAVVAGEIRHLLIQPTDEAGTRFEIESVRLIFRREYLASISSGVSWQGLSGIYHEAIVMRAAQVWRTNVNLPDRPWIDLSVGTVEPGPVTFRLTVRRTGDASAGEERVALERTITTPHRWERTPIDLGAFSGAVVSLALSVRAERGGTLGFWGGPVIRRHDARAPTTAAGSNDRAPSPQGVVVVWADTLRRDHLDVYGHTRPTAPVLRRMATEGALFRRCITQATWTKVSTPSLMTSLYPTSHGVKSGTDRIPASAITMAEVYRDAGYATFSFASNDFTGQITNLHQGFDEVHEAESLPEVGTNPTRGVQREGKTGRVGMDRVLPWIDAHQDVPFFAFLSLLDPHDPYKPYSPYDTLWADPSQERAHEQQTEDVRKMIMVPFLRNFGMPSRDELVAAGVDPQRYVDFNRAWYDGSIRGLDAEMSRLFERLRTLGLDKKTLVVFTSDHGEEFLEHGRTFHGQSTYGELNQVPLIVWQPDGVRAGTVVTEPVETIDLMPTLLEMSGLKGPAGMQGQSLLPLMGAQPGSTRQSAPSLSGPQASQAAAGRRHRPLITEKWQAKDDPPPLDTDSVAIISEGWKLIHNARRHAGTPEYELFDFEKDPLDQVDVAAQHPDIVQRLAKALDGWRAKASAERLTPDAETNKALSAEQLQRLRALGYVK